MSKNQVNIKLIRTLHCSVCSHPPPSDCHHFKSKGAGGKDNLDNLMPLCRKCHNHFHQIGALQWCLKYLAKVQQIRPLMRLPPLTIPHRTQQLLTEQVTPLLNSKSCSTSPHKSSTPEPESLKLALCKSISNND